MSLMSALVRHAGNFGCIGEIKILRLRYGIYVRPEGNIFPVRPCTVKGIKPAASVYDLQTGVLPEKFDQVCFCPHFLVGQFRVFMQFMA